uniref:Uncharacterized protein n=1 Tax=Vespula pensylvanica TaxID=30213 RepID=A0A834P4T6_VESPE|nr:hypothetical protein H0235_007403 [Vespula pensylvanica]
MPVTPLTPVTPVTPVTPPAPISVPIVITNSRKRYRTEIDIENVSIHVYLYQKTTFYDTGLYQIVIIMSPLIEIKDASNNININT